MNKKLDDNPFADVLVSAVNNTKRLVLKTLLPVIIAGLLISFVIGFVLGAIIF